MLRVEWNETCLLSVCVCVRCEGCQEQEQGQGRVLLCCVVLASYWCERDRIGFTLVSVAESLLN